MNLFIKVGLLAAVILTESIFNKGFSQTTIVTLDSVTNRSLAVSSNQVISVLGTIGQNGSPTITLQFANGATIDGNGSGTFFWLGTGSAANNSSGSATGSFTGVTNILVSQSIRNFTSGNYVPYQGAATFSVATPSANLLVPTASVVIPSDATGPVQIVLESSADMVNWSAALPGTYGSTYTNRFFRVRAIAQ